MRGLTLLAVAFVLTVSSMRNAISQEARALGQPEKVWTIWPALPPGDQVKPRKHERRINRNGDDVTGAVSGVFVPRMVVYRPAHPNGTAVLIMGGGGYYRIGIGREAYPAAQWLASLGVMPVILYYRLPGDGWAPVAPFQDGQRAMRLLRANAMTLGIDPHRIGVLGFSAGGNLAGITATRFAQPFYAAVDAQDQASSRPDFAALIYPVISLREPYDTTHSYRELASQPDAVNAYSVEAHVDHDTPPTFLAHAEDDPISNVDNSLMMFEALRKANVPAELHVFERGGHGWGLGNSGSLVAAWPGLFCAWARANAWLPDTNQARRASLPSQHEVAPDRR